MFSRLLTPSLARSFFLFGPRSTGKSTLLQRLLPKDKALWIDLLEPDMEFFLSQSPSRLTGFLEKETKSNRRKWVVIDEIQKVPALLSVVHQYIQQKRFYFALTGSSPRKLMRGAANLLGGRASWFELSSLTHVELGKVFDLEQVLRWGSLPEVFELVDDEKARFLKSYCHLYLKEEVVAEQLVRKVQPFRNFLELVSLQNAQIVNYSKFSRDCGVDITTIQTYFEILKDTLVGVELPSFHMSVRKRQRQNPKFYLFDTGVTRAMAGIIEDQLHPQTYDYGKTFEQFIVTEIHRLMKCYERDWKLSYLLTRDGAEVDLIIEKGRSAQFAIEIKSTDRVDEKEVRSFEKISKDIPHCRKIFISQDRNHQRYGNVDCLPWKDAINTIFST